jgi:hypothetical protein
MPTIGVFSLLPLPGFAGRLAVYARSLTLHGANVHRILCDGAQPRCATDSFLPQLPQRFGHCAGCFAGHRWLSGLGSGDDTGVLAVSSLIDADRQQAALAEIAGVADEALTAWTYEGHPCGQWLDNAMRNEYIGLHWQHMADWPQAARGWLGTMVTGILAADGYIRRYRPDALLIPNGHLAAERGIRAVAAARGIPVYCEDTGLRPGTYVVRRNSAASDFDFSPEWAQWADIPLTATEETHLDEVLASWQIHDLTKAWGFSPAATGNLAMLQETLNLSGDRPVVAVFPGVLDDTSLYNADRIYDHQAAWLDAVIDLAARRPGWQVVIRLHPIGATTHIRRQGQLQPIPDRLDDYLLTSGRDLPANVRVIHASSTISSHDLLASSRLVLTYVSTVGIEATLRGLPVILGGWPHYAHVGFTWNQATPADLAPLADRLMETPSLPTDAGTRARRYVYLAFLRGMIDLPFFSADNRSWDLPVEMQAFARHAADRDGELTRFCEAIMGRRPLVEPPPGLPPLLPAPVPAVAADATPPHPPSRLAIVIAAPDDNGFPVDWAPLAAAADDLLVVIGPQRRAPDHVPAGARLLTAAGSDLAACWQTALTATDADWLLLLEAGESLLAHPRDLQAVTRLRPLTPTLGLIPVRAGDLPEGTCWEPRLLSRSADWRISGQGWPVITSAAGGRQLGARSFLLTGMTIRSRTVLPARVAARRASLWLRDGLEAQPHAITWNQTLADVLRPTAPVAASRHEAVATGQPITTGRLSVAILVPPGQPLSRFTLDGIDAIAQDLLVVVAPGSTVAPGLVARHAGRLVVAADERPESLLAAARAQAIGTWLLTLQADEQLAPGSADALTIWLQTMGATKTGALIGCQNWPLAGGHDTVRREQRLWRLKGGGGGNSLAPLAAVPGVAIWQPPAAARLPVPALPKLPAPPPPALMPAVRQLMAGNLSAARVELLSWRLTAAPDDPQRPTADEWLITAAIALGDWALALTIADGVLDTRCRRPVLAIQAATVLQLAGDVSGAAQACRLAVMARQTWDEGPADIDWQPELLMASLILGTEGPALARSWLSQAPDHGPLAVMQALLHGLTGGTAEVQAPGLLDLATELATSGWLSQTAMANLLALEAIDQH